MGRDKLTPPTLSHLCSLGWRRLLITGLCRDLLIQHFADPEQIVDPDLQEMVWRADERTGILIESIHRWRGELVEKRPAVVVKPNAVQNMRLAIGDQESVDEQGHHHYATFWVGSHTLFCIHGSGASVEVLASEVQREMTQYASLMTSYLGLLRWQVTEMGEISEIEEAREGFVVPITVGWAYQERWMLRKESLKLRKISLTTLLDGALVDDA